MLDKKCPLWASVEHHTSSAKLWLSLKHFGIDGNVALSICQLNNSMNWVIINQVVDVMYCAIIETIFTSYWRHNERNGV